MSHNVPSRREVPGPAIGLGEWVNPPGGPRRHAVVFGGPGSGKTSAAIWEFATRVRESSPLADPGHVLLAATRRAATRARAAVSRELLSRPPLARRSPAVHTPQAFAFGIVRQFELANGGSPPALITGAEQDRILADLLVAHQEAGGSALTWPDSLPREALRIPAFREELRNLFMRAAEFSVSPHDLISLGEEHGRPEWVLAAQLWEEYLNVLSLQAGSQRQGRRFDSARVVGEAARLLDHWEDLTELPAPQFDSIIVDDYQEASAAVVRLLRAFARRGTHLTLLGDPDVAVQTFRGALPQFLERAAGEAALGGFSATVHNLPTVFRGTPNIQSLVLKATSRVPTTGNVARRRRAVDRDAEVEALQAASRGGGQEIRAALLPTPGAELGFIAQAVREANLYRGIAWSDMAVITRSASVREDLARGLRTFDIPLARSENAIVLREAPPVRMLMELVDAAAGNWSRELAESLLRSPLGRMDPLDLRRLARALAALDHGSRKLVDLLAGELELVLPAPQGVGEQAEPVELAETVGGQRAEPANPAEISGSELLGGLPAELAPGLARVRRAVHVTAAAMRASTDPYQVLWAAWEATGLAEEWKARALTGSERANRDLDAVVALFAFAEKFGEEYAGASVGSFLERVSSEALPTDTLAPSGQGAAGLEVLTVAQAAGREWDLVVLAGLQEGSWPDPRLRDSVLGAGHLAELQLDRLGFGHHSLRAEHMYARAQVMGDEWRMFAAALSRAKSALIATAVEGQEERASVFFKLVSSHVGGAESATAARRLDSRGMVAELRSILTRGNQAPESELQVTAARLLGILAAFGTPGAHPDSWAGLAQPTPLTPLVAAGQEIVVSPSRVETVNTCPLRWALDRAGGRRAESMQQSIGTLVHEIASEHPKAGGDTFEQDLLNILAERFSQLELPDGWARKYQLGQAEEMIKRYASYAATVPGEVETEVQVVAVVGEAKVVGQADRLEKVDGGWRVADLKTGSSAQSVALAAVNPQLGIYQLAFTAANRPAQGARLVYLGTRTKGATTREQPPLGGAGNFAEELLQAAVEHMKSAEFEAIANPECRHCPVRTSCPAKVEGGRISQ